MAAIRYALLVTAAIGVLAFPYIDLGLAADLGSWHADVPVADLAGAVLIALVGVALLLRRPTDLPALPGAAGYTLLLVASLLALPAALDPAASLHTLIRKPLFLWLAWGGALGWCATHLARDRFWHALVSASAGLCGAILLGSSVGRIASGSGLASAAVASLTANQKTLGVAIAPLLPLVLGLRRPVPRWAQAAAALLGLAVVLSASRTALVSVAVGLTFLLRFRGRRLAEVPGLVPALAMGGLVLALYAPLWTGSIVQLDALRSRHSLDVRSWAMFSAHPLFGMGAGTSTLYEMIEFPLYRVNGVDAHGAIQKVASEAGIVGLAGWLWATVTVGRRLLADRSERGTMLWACFVALHVNLLTSTETFSQTHWVPLGLIWGLSRRREGA